MFSVFSQFLNGKGRGFLPPLVVAIVCGLATTELQASCGDYLHVGNRGLHVGNRGAGPSDSVGDQASMSLPLSPLFPSPCRGPNCRRQIPVPVPSVPVPPSPRAEVVGLYTFERTFCAENSVSRSDYNSRSPFDGYPILLKRPPRS